MPSRKNSQPAASRSCNTATRAATPKQMLEQARELKRRLPNSVKLIMNDRADLCVAAGCDGVHVGQDDLSPEGARKVIGKDLWLGVSTHNPEQVKIADQTSADYIAIGPVFSTGSKANPDPVVGLDGCARSARADHETAGRYRRHYRSPMLAL